MLVLLLVMTGQVRSGRSYQPLFAIFTPLMEAMEFVADGFRDMVEDYLLLVDTEAENRKLLVQVERLELEQKGRFEVEDENRRLRALLGLKEALPCRVTGAEIIARDPTDPFQTVTLNKGHLDGLDLNMTVVGVNGLVGRIYAVSDSAAKVLLITDLKSSVAVRIAETREQSIMDGTGDDGCLLKYVHKDAPVRNGGWVYTSGLDGIYPEGIPVGQLDSVKQLDYGIFQEVTLRPAEQISRIEDVLVILSGSSCTWGGSEG